MKTNVIQTTCANCQSKVKSNQKFIQCIICQNTYHKKCSNLPNRQFYDIKLQNLYFCPECITSAIPFSSANNVELSFLNKGFHTCSFSDDVTINNNDSSFIDTCNNTNTDDDECHSNPVNSKYYNYDEFLQLNYQDQFIIFHTNIASINKHSEDLHNFLSLLNTKPDIIEISEHKLGKNSDLKKDLLGYNFVYNITESTHGGTGFLISNNINYHERKDLIISSSGSLESTFIEVNHTDKYRTVLGCIYKHPHMPISEFTEEYLPPLLEKISKEKKTYFLMGDFNIDLLRLNRNNAINSFYQTMCSYYFSPYILQPTRITGTSKTLIDNIFINSLNLDSISGNLTVQLSDHLFQFVILNNFLNKQQKQNCSPCYTRNFRHFHPEEFKEELSCVNWDEIISKTSGDINNTFAAFFNTLDTLLNEHALVRKLTKREISLREKPWINSEIKSIMHKRDKALWKLSKNKISAHKNDLFNEYKKLRNMTVHKIEKARLSYHSNYFKKHSNSIKNIWKGINSIISVKKSNKFTPNSVVVNGEITSSPNDIATAFNDFFTNIDPNLAKKYPFQNPTSGTFSKINN